MYVFRARRWFVKIRTNVTGIEREIRNAQC